MYCSEWGMGERASEHVVDDLSWLAPSNPPGALFAPWRGVAVGCRFGGGCPERAYDASQEICEVI
jgi:hypothetical protein